MCMNCIGVAVRSKEIKIDTTQGDCILLNDGDYTYQGNNTEFPVRVKGRIWGSLGFVWGYELIRVGFSQMYIDPEFEYPFHVGSEIERVV